MHGGRIIAIPVVALGVMVGGAAVAEPLCADTHCLAVLEDTATNGPHGGRPTSQITIGSWVTSAAGTTSATASVFTSGRY